MPRLPIASEADLALAVRNGLLEESHFLELKREVKPGKGENRELARDLASFAIDSGTLLVGVEERSDRSFELIPQPLSGLAERVDQVTTMIPDPPLSVITSQITSASDAGVGYLIVHVPASPVAPHMVDGRYLGRGDKGKRYLSDPEVTRLHERRQSREADAAALLEVEFSRDPIPAAARRQAHLFLLAEPATGRPSMLLHLTDGNRWMERLLLFARNRGAGPAVQLALNTAKITGFSPDIEVMATFDRRPGGAALTNGLGAGRVFRPETFDPESVAELEVYEDGGLRLFLGRLSDQIKGTPSAEFAPNDQVLFDAALVIYARRLVALVLGAADEAGYFGNWALAAGATGLKGCYPYSPTQRLGAGGDGVPYSGDVYRRSTLASYAELVGHPGQVADRLVGQLLRSLGTREFFAAALSDIEPSHDGT